MELERKSSRRHSVQEMPITELANLDKNSPGFKRYLEYSKKEPISSSSGDGGKRRRLNGLTTLSSSFKFSNPNSALKLFLQHHSQRIQSASWWTLPTLLFAQEIKTTWMPICWICALKSASTHTLLNILRRAIWRWLISRTVFAPCLGRKPPPNRTPEKYYSYSRFVLASVESISPSQFIFTVVEQCVQPYIAILSTV